MISVPPVLHPLFMVIPIPVPNKTPPKIAERRIFTGSETSRKPTYPVVLPKTDTHKERREERINVLRLYLRPKTNTPTVISGRLTQKVTRPISKPKRLYRMLATPTAPPEVIFAGV